MTQKEFFHALLKIRYFRGDAFTLEAVTEKTFSSMQSRYPDNQHIEAKIRQLLQQLRDDGELEFLGGGTYRLHRRGKSGAQLFPGTHEKPSAGVLQGSPDRLLRATRTSRSRLRSAERSPGLSRLEQAAETAEKYIEQNGGVVPAAELAAHLQAQHEFARRRSARLFRAPLFVLEDDLVRLRRHDEPYPVKENAAQQPGIFIFPGRITVLRKTDSDLRLLSRLSVDAATLGAFSVQPGGSRIFTTSLEPIRIEWRAMRERGEMIMSRANLNWLGRKDGNHVLFKFNLADETAEFDLHDSGISSSTALSQLRIITGLHGSLEEIIDSLDEALGHPLAGPEAALRARGDEYMAALITDARQTAMN